MDKTWSNWLSGPRRVHLFKECGFETLHGGRFADIYSVRRFYEFSVKLNVSKYSWFRNFQNTLAVQRVGLFLKLIRSTNISVDFLTGAGQRLGPVELRTATVFFTKK